MSSNLSQEEGVFYNLPSITDPTSEKRLVVYLLSGPVLKIGVIFVFTSYSSYTLDCALPLFAGNLKKKSITRNTHDCISQF